MERAHFTACVDTRDDNSNVHMDIRLKHYIKIATEKTLNTRKKRHCCCTNLQLDPVLTTQWLILSPTSHICKENAQCGQQQQSKTPSISWTTSYSCGCVSSLKRHKRGLSIGQSAHEGGDVVLCSLCLQKTTTVFVMRATETVGSSVSLALNQYIWHSCSIYWMLFFLKRTIETVKLVRYRLVFSVDLLSPL